MVLNLFNLDLHISVIAVFEYILKKIFPFDFKINSESMSEHAGFMKKNISNNYPYLTKSDLYLKMIDNVNEKLYKKTKDQKKSKKNTYKNKY